MAEVSKLHLPDFDFDFDQSVYVHGLPGPATATTTTIMPALLDSLALDATLPMDPSFVDIGHPGDPFPRLPPKDVAPRKGSCGTTTTTTTTTSGTSSTALSKQRSVSTPTSSANHDPLHASSKSHRRHRSTKSHPHPAIDDDLLLDLLKEFRAAKKREGATGSLNLNLGVKSLLSHGTHHLQHEQQPTQPQPPSLHHAPFPSGSPPRSHEPFEPALDKQGFKKRRERSASTASSSIPTHSHSKSSPLSSGSSSDSILILLNQLQTETARANAAENQVHEVVERLKVVAREKAEVEGQLLIVKEELGLYKVQLDMAQKEIYRAQEIVENVDRQRVLAEKDATRNRERLRRVVEDRLVREALEEGRREGYEEGIKRGREVENERRRLVYEQHEREREQEERAKERHSREREREKGKGKETVSRGRARSNTVGSDSSLKPVPPPRPPTAGPSNWPPVPPLQGLRFPAPPHLSGPPSWPAPPPAPPPMQRTSPPRIPYSNTNAPVYDEDNDEVLHIPDTGTFAAVLPRPTLTTPVPLSVPATHPQPAPAPVSMHAQHQHHHPGRKDSGSSGSVGSRDAVGASASTTNLQAKDPHFNRVVHPSYVPPPDNYIPVMGVDGLVSLPPPHELGGVVDDAMNRGRRSAAPSGSGIRQESRPRASSRVQGDTTPRARLQQLDKRQDAPGYFDQQHQQSERHVANPERERERLRMLMAMGSGEGEVVETPTPIELTSLPNGHVMAGYQGSSTNSGGRHQRRMHVVNADADVDTDGSSSRAGQARRAAGIERPKTVEPQAPPLPPKSRLRGVSLSESQRELGISNHAGGSSATSVLLPIPPVPPPGWGSLAAPLRMNGGGGQDFSTPEDRKSLLRTMTSGTTPEIGVEPPSQSPTSAGDSTIPVNPVFLSPNPAEVVPPNTTPQSYLGDGFEDHNQHYGNPTLARPQSTQPIYGRPPPYDDHDRNPADVLGGSYYGAPPFPVSNSPSGWMYQDPKQHGGFDFQSNHPFISSTPNSNASSGNHHLTSPGYHGKGDESEEWMPPPPVALSPIPMMTNLDLGPVKGTIKKGGSASPPGVGKDDHWVYGRPDGVGDGKYLSPAPLNRPISLFEDSE